MHKIFFSLFIEKVYYWVANLRKAMLGKRYKNCLLFSLENVPATQVSNDK